jgi:D-alanyl-D-alanine dipeptidase
LDAVRIDPGRIDATLRAYVQEASDILAEQVPGASLVVVSGYRDPEKQAALRRRWLAGDRRGLVSEPVLDSKHTRGRAVDVQIVYRGNRVPVKDTPLEYWEFLAALLEPVGVRWGGRFKQRDLNHFDI